jgi:hypothetical protein
MQPTWHALLERSPELAELKADAASIAKLERWPWYELWLPTSTIFLRAVAAAAERVKHGRDSVREIALTGLLDAYHTAKRRLQRR